MKLNLELFHLKELQRNSLTLDMVFVLMLVEKGHVLSDICKDDNKMQIIQQGLIRKGLVTSDNKITLPAKNILKFMNEPVPKEKLIKKKVNASEFTRWWKCFPGTNIFKINGKSFTGSRTLKRDEEGCRLKFNAILAEGEYTADEIIAATEFDIMNKKKLSYDSGENKLTFLQNSLTYLNQRSFEPYIEIVKQGITIDETSVKSKGVDI